MKGSRFLAILEPCADRAGAEGRLEELREKYREATHVCWAWRLRPEPDPGEASSDAGEPAGTAGVPVLGVLRSEGLWNVLGIVVRWFGGTKLGRGGLIKAYRDAMTAAVESAGIIEELLRVEVELRTPVELIGDVHRVLSPLDVKYLDQSVEGETATMSVSLPARDVEGVREQVIDATRGEGSVEIRSPGTVY